MSLLTDRLFAICAQYGVSFLDSDKESITSVADSIADDFLDKVITAFANNLGSGGIKNLEFGAIKKDLLSIEPQIDQAANDQISKLFDTLTEGLKNVQFKYGENK